MFLRAGPLATSILVFTSLTMASAKVRSAVSSTDGPSYLLTHAEFSRLTLPEQKAYVRDVQRVLASLPERGRAFASSGSGTFPARPIASRMPKRSVASEGSDDEPRADRLRFTAGATEVDGEADADPEEESDGGEAGSKPAPSLAEAVGARAPTPPPQSTPPPAAGTRPGAAPAKPAAPAFGQPTMLTEIPASARAEIAAESAAAEPRSNPSGATDGRFYRCMYAGFVLKQDPCKGPRELPADVKLEGLSRERLACPKDEVLCNPLLFGLKTSCDLMPFDASKKDCLEKAEPICIHRSVSATADCAARSNDQSVSAAAALIGANATAWNDYLTSFYELCDDEKIAVNGFAEMKNGSPREVPERTRTDIRQTCAHAKEQLAHVTEKYRSVETKRPGPPAAEGSKGER